jgi:hypothetical protein
MHIHLPKPLHGWRELFGEVGIIVLGVLIALGLEQIAETIHERREAAEARENVRSEAAFDLQSINDRIAVESCIDRRIDELATILRASGDGPIKGRPTWVGRPPTGPFFTTRWEAATASGRNSLFAPQEQERFGQLYEIFSRFNAYQAREQEVWANLRALETWQGPLGPDARLSFVKDLQQARYLAWDLNFAGRRATENLGATGIVLARPNPGTPSICLPIDTPRAEALRRFDPAFGQP